MKQFGLIAWLWCWTLLSAGAADIGNWKVSKGYRVQIDTSGFEFPVAIQFVPNPGSDPLSPLYYVTEIRGRIKVVTQNRQVFVYADHIEKLEASVELPDLKGEFGTTGLCLDEASGHVYVTTVYWEGGLLFNKILRYASETNSLGLQGTLDLEIKDLFRADRSSLSHQIGNCVVSSDQKLYVGVGDAHQHESAQLLQHSLGKVLRFNLDGTAPSDNPFYQPSQAGEVESYVYSYGLRNPFALAEVHQVIYAGESGPSVDRLLKLIPGRNYLWDGTDASMLINGIVTWPEPLGPASMVYLEEHPLFPQWHHRLLITASVKAYLTSVWIDNQLGAKAPPEVLLSYIGSQETERQYLVPVAVGSDGIYFSGFLPQADGKTHIMKIIPSGTLDDTAVEGVNGERLFRELGCSGCHSIGGVGGSAGPSLDNLVFRVEKRLRSPDYAKKLDYLDTLTAQPFSNPENVAVRKQLRTLKGKKRLRLWIESRLREPLFDTPDSQMPNLHLTDEQIKALTHYLMQIAPKNDQEQQPLGKRLGESFKFYLNTHWSEGLGIAFVLGLLITFPLNWLIRKIRMKVKQKKDESLNKS